MITQTEEPKKDEILPPIALKFVTEKLDDDGDLAFVFDLIRATRDLERE